MIGVLQAAAVCMQRSSQATACTMTSSQLRRRHVHVRMNTLASTVVNVTAGARVQLMIIRLVLELPVDRHKMKLELMIMRARDVHVTMHYLPNFMQKRPCYASTAPRARTRLRIGVHTVLRGGAYAHAHALAGERLHRSNYHRLRGSAVAADQQSTGPGAAATRTGPRTAVTVTCFSAAHVATRRTRSTSCAARSGLEM